MKFRQHKRSKRAKYICISISINRNIYTVLYLRNRKNIGWCEMWIGEHAQCSDWHDLLLKLSAEYNFDAKECHNHTCSASEIKQQTERRYVHVRWLRSKTRTNVCRNKKFMLFLFSGGERPLSTDKMLHICLYLFWIPMRFSSTPPGVRESFQVSLVPMLEQRIAKHTQQIKKQTTKKNNKQTYTLFTVYQVE